MTVTRSAGQAATRGTYRCHPSRTSRSRQARLRAAKPILHTESSNSDAEASQPTECSNIDGAPIATEPLFDRRPSPSDTVPKRCITRANAARRMIKAKNIRAGPLWVSKVPRLSGAMTGHDATIPPLAQTRKSSLQPDQHGPAGLVPDWRDPRISFECWADIFHFAASLSTTGDLASGWLVHSATTCRAFAEPALTTLYRCPQIRNPTKAKRLVTLLELSPSDTLYNYRSKVELLHVNIHVVPQAVLFQLIRPLHRLKELIIYTPMDQPPYRELDRTVRWHYSDDIFRALAQSGDHTDAADDREFATALKSWEWSGRLIGGCVPNIQSIACVHDTPPFSQLTKLSVTNFQVPSLGNLQQPESEEAELRNYHEDCLVVDAVAHAISRLARLDHLVFESSTVLNDRLLHLLPKQLVHLELINCWEVKSEDLAAFLHTHGSNLRILTLLHNQSLNLGFLTTLSQTCPRLGELYMNLSYYRHHDCVDDADPMYEHALLPSQVPTWPSSLRVIRIEHIQHWSVQAAEICLQSLVDSASVLPNLRHLVIKTRLDIPWQARATLRRKWRATMEKVFQRPWTSPRPYTTLHALPRTKRLVSEPSSPTSLRSRKKAAGHLPEANKSLRRQSQRLSYRDFNTDEDGANLSDGAESLSADSFRRGDEVCKPAIQGLCSTVNLQFDNQKVRELQYGMGDFVNEDEAESEDEWEGDKDEDESIVSF
ncbi:hypothetical protein CDD83_2365 [Cordyceps sp. RAO-2017]|nr:hypothetical protein CDD83_2365 [Cordyceps sp. RAO-2017]